MEKVLMLGGTRFFGKELVEELLKSGHDVTILTRGNVQDDFSDKVKRIKADRRDEKSLKDALEGLEFDVVYDNICYSPNEAYISTKVFKGKVKKYIVTSSVAVYNNNPKENLREYDFNQREYEVKFGNREDFSYGEGKRLAEAVFEKYADFPVTMVRFPVVIGMKDYTNRLNKYIELVENEEKIFTKRLNEKMNFITSNEAALFLKWIKEKEINGPINASCTGEVSLKEIIEIIEKALDKKARVDTTLDIEDTSPYNDQVGLTVSTVYIRGFYFYRFKSVLSEITELIESLVKMKVKDTV